MDRILTTVQISPLEPQRAQRNPATIPVSRHIPKQRA